MVVRYGFPNGRGQSTLTGFTMLPSVSQDDRTHQNEICHPQSYDRSPGITTHRFLPGPSVVALAPFLVVFVLAIGRKIGGKHVELRSASWSQLFLRTFNTYERKDNGSSVGRITGTGTTNIVVVVAVVEVSHCADFFDASTTRCGTLVNNRADKISKGTRVGVTEQYIRHRRVLLSTYGTLADSNLKKVIRDKKIAYQNI